MFLVTGVVFPLAVLPDRRRGPRPAQPDHLVGRGRAARARARRARSSIGGEGSLWTAVTGTSAPDGITILVALFAHRGARYTRGDRDLPVERASRPGAGPARPDHRLVARRGGAGSEATQRGSSHADLRGQPAAGLRGGLPLDRRLHRQPRDARHPAPRGARRVHRPGARDRRRRCRVRVVRDASGRSPRRPSSFLDDDIAKFMEEAAARRASGAEASDRGGTYERALRVIGHWIDTQHPKDVFLFEQGGAVRRPAPPRGAGGLAPRARRVHPGRHRAASSPMGPALRVPAAAGDRRAGARRAAEPRPDTPGSARPVTRRAARGTIGRIAKPERRPR